jgi:nicotinamide-nucleotide adenylyltransferase
MIALFIGRFQPLHKGHVEYMKKILKTHLLKIVIGSAQDKNTAKNPFSAAEREQMLKLCIKADIFTAKDYPGENSKWLNNINKTVGQFDIVYIGENKLVYDIFTQAGYEVKTMKRIKGISSTKIRNLIKEKKEWKHLVPEPVYQYIISIRGDDRIRKI